MIITFCFSFDRDSEGAEYQIYTGLINIPSSSGLVAVSVVSKNVPHTLEVNLYACPVQYSLMCYLQFM